MFQSINRIINNPSGRLINSRELSQHIDVLSKCLMDLFGDKTAKLQGNIIIGGVKLLLDRKWPVWVLTRRPLPSRPGRDLQLNVRPLGAPPPPSSSDRLFPRPPSHSLHDTISAAHSAASILWRGRHNLQKIKFQDTQKKQTLVMTWDYLKTKAGGEEGSRNKNPSSDISYAASSRGAGRLLCCVKMLDL